MGLILHGKIKVYKPSSCYHPEILEISNEEFDEYIVHEMQWAVQPLNRWQPVWIVFKKYKEAADYIKEQIQNATNEQINSWVLPVYQEVKKDITGLAEK